MFPEGVRDAAGGAEAMAERLEVCVRAVRHRLGKGVKRRKLEGKIRGLVEMEKIGRS